jgi:putative membrane protein
VGFLGYIVIQIAVNILTLLAADYFVPGVDLQRDFVSLVQVTAVITGFNIFVKPIMTLLLGPFILLTFGLLLIVINAALLWLIAYLIPGAIVFASPIALLGSALILSVGNFAISLARKAK